MKVAGIGMWVAMLLSAVAASAQTNRTVEVTGLIGAAAGGGVGANISGSVQFRFNRIASLELEIGALTGLDHTSPYYYIAIPQADSSTSVTLVSQNVRVDIPTVTPRVLPYVVVGGGIAAVRDKYPDIIYALSDVLPSLASLNDVSPGPAIYPPIRAADQYTTALALTLGGGARFPVSDHLSFDVDLRFLHLVGDRDVNAGRFSGGISYGF